MKYLSFLMITSLALLTVACNESNDQNNFSEIESLSEADLFKQNVSLFDARTRSVNTQEYTKELKFVDFSGQTPMPSTIAFQGMLFADTGEGLDLIAGDGVYTSVESFTHSSEVPYVEGQTIRSVLSNPLVDPAFRQSQQLSLLAADYELRSGEVQSRILEVTCPITFGTNGCRAERWGWCTNCCFSVDFDNCTVTVGF